MRNSGRYPLCGRGDINLYAVFAEGMRNLLNDRGRVGCVLPTGIATDDTTKFFFQDVVETKSLVSLFDFENRKLFPGRRPASSSACLPSAEAADAITAAAEFIFFATRLSTYVTPSGVSRCPPRTSRSSIPTPAPARFSARAATPSSRRPSTAGCRC